MNLAGIKRILELELQVDALRHRVSELAAELEQALHTAQRARRVFAAGPAGEVVAVQPGRRPRRTTAATSSALVVWRPER